MHTPHINEYLESEPLPPLTLSPPARIFHQMVYDVDRSVTVLFGGTTDSDLNDTWEYDGLKWTEVSSQFAPSPRYWHGMVYDQVKKAIVLLSSRTGLSWNEDTWVYK